jgi:hypothetical protein
MHCFLTATDKILFNFIIFSDHHIDGTGSHLVGGAFQLSHQMATMTTSSCPACRNSAQMFSPPLKYITAGARWCLKARIGTSNGAGKTQPAGHITASSITPIKV